MVRGCRNVPLFLYKNFFIKFFGGAEKYEKGQKALRAWTILVKTRANVGD